MPSRPARRFFLRPLLAVLAALVLGPVAAAAHVGVARTAPAAAAGHPLQGEWAFVVEGGEASVADPLPAAQAGPAPPPPPAAAPVAEPAAVAVRWLWFASLLGMVGAVAFRYGVLRTLERQGEHREVARRAEAAVWYVALAAAALSAISLLTRLWVQTAAAGGGGAWDGDALRRLLAGTSWGLAWTLQAIATVAFFMGLLVARAPHGRAAGWMGAAVGAILLATVPALSGHAAAAGDALPIVADALHVLGAGTWLGTLGAVLAVGIPAALTSRDAPGPAVAALVAAFSPVALAGAATVALTGGVGTLYRLSAPADLWATAYGRVLLVKVALLGVVAVLGWRHWRRAGPALGAPEAVAPLRRSIGAELTAGALVLLATAVLVALPTP